MYSDTDNLPMAIAQAFTNHEFTAYYQPQYKALTGRLAGAEALARWRKQDGSIVSPADFIPYMEQSHMICDLDWYILGEV